MLMMVGIIPGCVRTSDVRTVGQLEHQLSHAIDLFIQCSRPNSMAREPGFDLTAHLQSLGAQWDSTTAVFHSPEGVAFLGSRIDSESDEMALVGILKILHESHQSEAQPILLRFARHPSSQVSQRASEYLSMSR